MVSCNYLCSLKIGRTPKRKKESSLKIHPCASGRLREKTELLRAVTGFADHLVCYPHICPYSFMYPYEKTKNQVGPLPPLGRNCLESFLLNQQ